MEKLFEDYLFNKHILVSYDDIQCLSPRDQFSFLTVIGQKFGVRIIKGVSYAQAEMIQTLSDNLGMYIPDPFYNCRVGRTASGFCFIFSVVCCSCCSVHDRQK